MRAALRATKVVAPSSLPVPGRTFAAAAAAAASTPPPPEHVPGAPGDYDDIDSGTLPPPATAGTVDYVQVASKAMCAGRNYVAHAAELNNPLPDEPFFFLKPTTAFNPFNGTPLGGVSKTPNLVEFPKENELHHELELCVIIGERGAKNVAEADALDCVAGYAVGLEMTLRDVQTAMKAKQLPWMPSKAFDTSLPLGPFIPASVVPDPSGLEIWMTIDGETVQSAPTSLMIFSVQRLIADASRIMTLNPGDILCTGTPSGVGRVFPGQIMRAGIKGFEAYDIEFGCAAV